MKTYQLRDMTVDEVKIHLNDVQEELFNLRMQRAFKQIPNPKRITHLRKEIARCNTLLHEHKTKIRPLKGGHEEE